MLRTLATVLLPAPLDDDEAVEVVAGAFVRVVVTIVEAGVKTTATGVGVRVI
jgi:hypothetical protein